MKSIEKRLQAIRRMEAELAYATPSRAATLTGKLVKARGELFSD